MQRMEEESKSRNDCSNIARKKMVGVQRERTDISRSYADGAIRHIGYNAFRNSPDVRSIK